MRTATIPIRTDGRTIDFVLADDLPTLVWLANLADLELHTSLARAADPRAPTILAFDLDPGAPATIVECAQVALRLREAFEHLGLEGFPKTSGSKGMQVYVPLNVPTTYAQTKRFSQAIAQLLERRHPELVVSEMRKDLRRGKVFVDWSQNDEHKTTVAAYSLRARERPTVSTPLLWEEVEAVAESGDPDELVFTSADVLERVAEHGDLFAPGRDARAGAAGALRQCPFRGVATRVALRRCFRMLIARLHDQPPLRGRPAFALWRPLRAPLRRPRGRARPERGVLRARCRTTRASTRGGSRVSVSGLLPADPARPHGHARPRRAACSVRR